LGLSIVTVIIGWYNTPKHHKRRAVSRKDFLDKEFTNLSSWRQMIFSVFLMLLGGEGVMIYAIVSGDKPLFVGLLAIAAFVGLTVIAVYLKRINDRIEENLAEQERI
jgi:hypothetical protein